MNTTPKTPISKAMDMTEETSIIEGARRYQDPLMNEPNKAEVEGHYRYSNPLEDTINETEGFHARNPLADVPNEVEVEGHRFNAR